MQMKLIFCYGLAYQIPYQDAAIIMCGMWSLWMMRNSRRHGEKVIPVREAVQWVWETSFDLWHKLHLEKEKEPKPKPHWRKPDEGWIKCSVDGSFLQHDSTGSFAAVMRDHAGRFRAASAAWQDRAQSAMTMEAQACRLGVELARANEVTKLCLETDSLEVVSLWNSADYQRSAIGFILQEIKALSRGFMDFSFVFLPRSCNRVAHECARLVSREQTSEVWHLEPPAALRHLLDQDCNHPSQLI